MTILKEDTPVAPSKVYFTDFHTTFQENQIQKFARLILTAGIDQIDFKDKYVAVKMHFGEPGNLAYLRANYARVVIDIIKDLGGKPFLVDCNTLYIGGRKNGLDHLEAAYQNGFNPYNTGCHVIIADGIKGTDEVLVPIDGEYVKEAKIGTAVMDADIIISLSHFKLHEEAGIGGAMKNIGMGCGSRAGKMEMHHGGKVYVEQDLCVGCGQCRKICAHDAPAIENRKANIDLDKCVGCGRCISVCPLDAIQPIQKESNNVLNYKIAEYTKAVLQGRPHFHITLIKDVSPYCDCHSENDVPIIPDVGMYASFDPVAIDMACADALNAQKAEKNSMLGMAPEQLEDHVKTVHPTTNWRSQIEHAKKIGLGTDEYEIITI